MVRAVIYTDGDRAIATCGLAGVPREGDRIRLGVTADHPAMVLVVDSVEFLADATTVWVFCTRARS